MGNCALSLIVVVEQGGSSLERMLNHLAVQRLPRGVAFQTLLVDCRETPQPPSDRPFPLRWVVHPKESFGYVQRAQARHRGATLAEGTILIFLDEGLLVREDFLERHWAYHQAAEHVCLVGVQSPLNEGEEIDAAEPAQLKLPEMDLRWLADAAPWALMDGTNFSLPRLDYYQVGGYDLDYAVYEQADAELGYRLWKAGQRILYSPSTIAFRPPMMTYPKTRWRGQGLDYIDYAHPELTGWAQARQLLLALRDHNFFTTEKMFLSERYLQSLGAQLSHNAAGAVLPPQQALACVCDQGKELGSTFTRLANATTVLPPFELIVMDAAQAKDSSSVEVATQTAPVPFPVHYYRADGDADSRGEVLCDDAQAEPLSRLVLKGSVAAKRDSLWPLRQTSRAPCLIPLEPAEVPSFTTPRPAVTSGRRERITDAPWSAQRHSPRLDMPDALEWDTGSVAEGYSYPPRTVSFKLTNLCNLRCQMCGQWGPQGNIFRQEKATWQDHMDLATLRTVVDQIAAFRPGMIYIWGGEPFLHPDFLDFIHYLCRERKLYTLINTNGTRLLDTARALVAIGPQYLRVSLDGPPEVHDRIRGQAGTFARAVEGIRAIDRLKREQDRLFPIVEVDCTISKDSYRSLEALLPELEGTGVARVAFSHLVYVTLQEGEAHQRLFRDLFGCEAVTWKGFVQDTTSIDTELLSRTVMRLQDRKNNLPVTFDPPMRQPGEVDLHYRDAASLYHNRYCCAPWLWAEIHANGDMAFCDDFPDYVLGNVGQDSFRSVWNGERARRFRRELLARKRFPICVHCGFLHHDPTF